MSPWKKMTEIDTHKGVAYTTLRCGNNGIISHENNEYT